MSEFTEGELLVALRQRHTYSGNGGSGRWAFLTHVRTGAAWDQQEMDALAIDLWPSGRHDLHAFEVKCSRSDWLREIRPDTSKSDAARAICDTFTIVALSGLVRTGELPVGWGLIEATRTDAGIPLRRVVKPARLQPLSRPHERTISRGFLAAILRAAGVVPGMTTGLKRRSPRAVAVDPGEGM